MKHLLCLFLTLTTVSSAFSLGEAEMLKRLAAFQPKDIGKTASAEKIDFLYRIHEFPAHEHLKRTVIVLYEIKIIAPPGRDYEAP